MRKSEKKREYLYEVVYNDRFQLPVFAGDIKEVCAYTGRTANSIHSAISHQRKYQKKGGQKGIRQIVVGAGWCDIDDDVEVAE